MPEEAPTKSRGAYTHGEPTPFEEAVAKDIKQRKEWAERDRANGTEYVHPKYLPKPAKVKDEGLIGPPDPRAGRKR